MPGCPIQTSVGSVPDVGTPFTTTAVVAASLVQRMLSPRPRDRDGQLKPVVQVICLMLTLPVLLMTKFAGFIVQFGFDGAAWATAAARMRNAAAQNLELTFCTLYAPMKPRAERYPSVGKPAQGVEGCGHAQRRRACELIHASGRSTALCIARVMTPIRSTGTLPRRSARISLRSDECSPIRTRPWPGFTERFGAGRIIGKNMSPIRTCVCCLIPHRMTPFVPTVNN